MKIIGLDIGTTSVSGVVIDPVAGEQLISRTVPNNTAVASEPWMHELDSVKILDICQDILDGFKREYPDIRCIALTGQMHGIVYVDGEGKQLGNLTTWEDERGNQPYKEGCSYAQFLQQQSGYPMSTGFGLTTHFYNMINHLVPEGAVKVCTIMDYVAMRLCGHKEPCIHPSNAAGIGLFDIPGSTFDEEQLRRLGMDPSILPEVVREEKIIGQTADGIQVMIPIGDNQAGSYAVLKEKGDVLLNIGTSSQISVTCDSYVESRGLECRPYVYGKYLLLYAGLCGGISFALLNQFFRNICEMFSVHVSEKEVFDKMMQEAEKVYGGKDGLKVSTLFRGTRTEPLIRGSITDIGVHNFTLGNMALGFYYGVIEELYEAFCTVMPTVGEGRLLLGGNALRNNALLRRICMDKFERQAVLLAQKEEAALGTARLAADVLSGKNKKTGQNDRRFFHE